MNATYRTMNEQINPSDDLRQRIMEKLEAKPKGRLNLRPLAAAAAVLAVVLLATPVMAAYVPPIEELMYKISPEIAARFSPVRESDEKNGIRMEVISASVHGATAEVYVSFQDLEGDRLGWNVWPGDFWMPVHPFLDGSAASGSRNGDYEEESKIYRTILDCTYSFYSEKKGRYLTVQELCGEKLTVSLDALNRMVPLGEFEVPLMMTEQGETQILVDEHGLVTAGGVKNFGWGYSAGEVWDPQGSFKLLKPGKAVQELSEGVCITGMGYIDGRLHIQTQVTIGDDAPSTPSYTFYLVDGQGKWVNHTRTAHYILEEDEAGGQYFENIFNVPEEALSQYTLICEMSKIQRIEGPWRVTFPLTESSYVGELDDGVPQTTGAEGFIFVSGDVVVD